MKTNLLTTLTVSVAMWISLAHPSAVSAQTAGPNSVVNSKHNLSASGPGTIKSGSEQEVCIFCHTPHNASAIQPLWNRNVTNTDIQPYTLYTSPSLIAQPGQPQGYRKLCLSCHDGTIALGSVLSTNQPITDLSTLQGSTNLGVNLSGDHPISFAYTSDLATAANLVQPNVLPASVKLQNGNLECTTCHDAHDDSRGDFLVMDNSNSQLCTSCHLLSGQATITGHDQCIDCHQEHNAPSGALLLVQDTVTDTCATCHGSSVPSASGTPVTASARSLVGNSAGANARPGLTRLAKVGVSVTPDLNKSSRHNADNGPGLINPKPTSITVNKGPVNSVNCGDCHESHTIKTGVAQAPNISPALGKASGITLAGAPTAAAKYEYEVCFKCHGTNNADRPFVTRKAVQTNIRLEFDTSAVSYHPITAPGRNHIVPSLAPGLTPASLIYCTDCHNSDSSKKAGGPGPDGPHGSNKPPLLLANYDTIDGTSESSIAYALCYRCHERTSILANQSFAKHEQHIVNDRAPCSVCHDAHGVSAAQGTVTNNAHLINFDTTVVFPDPITKKLEYDSTGPFTGKCYLLCHGKDHSGLKYP